MTSNSVGTRMEVVVEDLYQSKMVMYVAESSIEFEVVQITTPLLLLLLLPLGRRLLLYFTSSLLCCC